MALSMDPDQPFPDPSACCATCADCRHCKSIPWTERPCEQQRAARNAERVAAEGDPAPWQRPRPGGEPVLSCTCPPGERPEPCPRKYALSVCRAAAEQAALSKGAVAAHMHAIASGDAYRHTFTSDAGVETSARHAFFKRRLRELGMYDADADYDGMIGKSIEALSATFASQGHSGMSAQITLGLFNQLMDEYNNPSAQRDVREQPTLDAKPFSTAAHAIVDKHLEQIRRDADRELAQELFGTGDTAGSGVHTFTSGAKSSGQLPRYDLIPWHVFAPRLAARYQLGAEKYGEVNWQHGLADRAYVLDRANHALDHLHRAVEQIRSGAVSNDDDLAAALWGIIFLMAAQRGSADL